MSAERTPHRILLVGAGELGQEAALAARRLGVQVVAVDRYDGAPAMQVAHVRELVDPLDGAALEAVVRSHAPAVVVPEIEAIRSERLVRLAREGFSVVPTAEALRLASTRAGMRDLAARELGLPTPAYGFAESEEELRSTADEIGYPCLVKPILSFSGRGHSVVGGPARVARAWAFAREEGPGDIERVMVEEFVEFEEEVTLLALRDAAGRIRFLPPIGHRQEAGGYRESWIPADIAGEALGKAQDAARRIVDRLGGVGVYGVEFFILGEEVLFSEISPGLHDTGFVTLISHDLSEFELHVRAALDLPVPEVRFHGPAASAVILAGDEGTVRGYEGVARALEVPSAQLRIFGKPTAHRDRRMGVSLATGETIEEARARALEAASRVEIRTG